MKRKLSLLLGLVLLLGIMLPAAATEGKKLNVCVAGSYNLRVLYEGWVEMFNNSAEYNPNKHVAELQFLPSGAGGQSIDDKLLAAVGAGQTNTDFDLVELGDDQISRLLSEAPDLMMAYDPAKIPNLEKVSARTPNGPEFFMAYRGTTVVMAYNSKNVPEPPKTTEELTAWIKANPGRFSYNTPGTGGSGDSFASTSVYNLLPDEAFMSNDPKWEAEWDPGFAYLAEIHPFLYKSSGRVVYPNKNQGTLDLLAEGQIDMTPAWADMTLSQLQQGVLPPEIKIYQLQPSLTGAVSTLGIPAFGSNPEGAHDFMNFVLSDEAQIYQLQQIAAIPLVKVDDPATALVADLDVSKFRTQSIGELYVNFNLRWEEEIATLP